MDCNITIQKHFGVMNLLRAHRSRMGLSSLSFLRTVKYWEKKPTEVQWKKALNDCKTMMCKNVSVTDKCYEDIQIVTD